MVSETEILRVDTVALESITKSEVEQQLQAAHRWPRRSDRFMADVTALIEAGGARSAASCWYKLPARSGGGDNNEPIEGPSVRLAEMCVSAWGNLHVGARVIEVGEREVTAQAMVWDLEKNNRISIEARRGIVTKYGKRYSDSLINTTAMAAISIALRNAVFRIIPRAYVNALEEVVNYIAVGGDDEAAFLEERERTIRALIERMHVPLDRITRRLGVGTVTEINREMLRTLQSYGTALRTKETTVDEAFPPLTAAPAPGTVSKATAAADLISRAKSKSTPPPPSDAPLTPDTVLRELHAALESWEELDRTAALAIIEAWSPAELRIAYDWAIAHNDPDLAEERIPERPSFVDIEPMREPGEEG